MKKEIENLQKQREIMFNSETMKMIYSDYLDKLDKIYIKSEELNKIFSIIRKEKNNIVQINNVYQRIDIKRVSDPTIRNACIKMLEAQKLCKERTSTINNQIEIFNNLQIKVIDIVEKLCEKIINDTMNEDYIDYSSIIDMVEFISSNIPGISQYMNIITTLKTLLDVRDKLNNSTQKYETLTNIDNELFKLEEKIKVLNTFIDYLESIIDIFNKNNFIANQDINSYSIM